MNSSARPHEDCPPQASALINSLRAFGYDFATAIADLIDNSIFAGAKNISVDFSWNNGDPWFRIMDDGSGMTEKTLRDAMRLGTQNPRQERDVKDLGRFGLGLKTAAFSQGRILVVKSKTRPKNASIRCWDLDHVEKTNRWELSVNPPADAFEQLACLDELDRGTVVLCQKLDRLVVDPDDENADANFFARFDHVAQYLETVFHRFLSGRPKLNIKVGLHECKPWDPFMRSNSLTQERSTETLDRGRVKVTPFVLPHVSKRTTKETRLGAGLAGWNAHQGFYIYRNKRMIIHGGYLDFELKPEEHYKLCRIRIDLPNNVDHEWSIDVRKASASPPSHVRGDLERIAKSTRQEAAEIYRVRSGQRKTQKIGVKKQEIWNRVRKGDKVLYKINRDNEAIQHLLEKIDAKKSDINALFHLIEKAVPHRAIILDNSENEDCHVNLPAEVEPPPKELLRLCEDLFRSKLKSIKDPDQAARIVCSSFPPHVSFRAHLDNIIAEMN